MRRQIFSFLFIFITLFFQAQSVIVKGVARDTTKTRNFVHITVNDTLRKYREMATKAKIRNGDAYLELTKNKDFVTRADSLGNYTIKAKLTDTLYFAKYKHYTQKYKVEDIIKNKIKVQLVPEPCVPYVACEEKIPSQFYIFIGEKIAMNFKEDPYYCNAMSLDMGGFECTYRIKEKVYGGYPKDTIEFKAYDHYGSPAFGKYKNVLLFVSEYCGKLYHEKYQFYDLFKTKDGRWASPGDPYKNDQFLKEKTIEAQKMEFGEDAWVDLSKMVKKEKEKYALPYYKVVGDKAFPLMGNYVDDLVKAKANGVLKGRSIKLDRN